MPVKRVPDIVAYGLAPVDMEAVPVLVCVIVDVIVFVGESVGAAVPDAVAV